MSRGKKTMLKKLAAVAALTVFFEAYLMPSFASNWNSISARDFSERGMTDYVAQVIRENRTGLGALEEHKLAEVILVESVAHRVDPLFVLALIKTESTFYNWSKSFRGAVGLMQILPSTGKALAAELKMDWNGEATLLDPYANVRMGIHYFASLTKRFDGAKESLAAYNSGPTYLAASEAPGDVSKDFVNKVLANYKDLKERAVY